MVVTCGIDNKVITTRETSTHRRRNGGGGEGWLLRVCAPQSFMPRFSAPTKSCSCRRMIQVFVIVREATWSSQLL